MVAANFRLCHVCGIPGTKVCGRCRSVHYCDKGHQTAHWKLGHSAACKPATATVPASAAAPSASAVQSADSTDATKASDTSAKSSYAAVAATAAVPAPEATKTASTADSTEKSTATNGTARSNAETELRQLLFPEFEIDMVDEELSDDDEADFTREQRTCSHCV